MSLDVYLIHRVEGPPREGIFIRDSGGVREVSREEWDQMCPGREPTVCTIPDLQHNTVYSRNITHNLNRMAVAAGCYGVVWRPDENAVTTAGQLIEPLTVALATLRSDPDYFRTFNPSNGWGTYDDLLKFVQDYQEACVAYPDAVVYASR